MKILDKQQNYDLLMNMAFGNRIGMWNSLDELIADSYEGRICMRYKAQGPLDVRPCAYDLSLYEAKQRVMRWVRGGLDEARIVFNASQPSKKLLLQGEFLLSDPINCKPYLFYSKIKFFMRQALESDSHHAFGLEAINLLKSTMNECSYSDFEALLDIYGENVIEFSTYSTTLGIIPSRNTIIWEVRSY